MKSKSRNETNWYVITGGPSTGKTTLINMLSNLGYNTTIEHARHYIDTRRVEGVTVKEIRGNQLEFQLQILDMQIEKENELNPQELVFLDRAIPDALAYFRFLGLRPTEALLQALRKVHYRKIFVLDLLPLVKDYARREDEADQAKIHQLIIDVYESLPFPIVHIPVLSPQERLDIILKQIEE